MKCLITEDKDRLIVLDDDGDLIVSLRTEAFIKNWMRETSYRKYAKDILEERAGKWSADEGAYFAIYNYLAERCQLDTRDKLTSCETKPGALERAIFWGAKYANAKEKNDAESDQG